MPPPRDAGYPTLLFITKAEFAAWLKQHHATDVSVWMQLAKKSSSLT